MSANDVQLERAEIPEPSITRFLFADTRTAPVWFILRLWLGYQWLHAAWESGSREAR